MFLGEPLRELCSLASGYPLHHLLRGVAASQVVPLLSLSLSARFARGYAGIKYASIRYLRLTTRAAKRRYLLPELPKAAIPELRSGDT